MVVSGAGWQYRRRVSDPLVSVIVVPREGFRQAPSRLAELIERTSTPFHLVYVDGNSPARIARRIRRLVSERGGTLIRTERFLRPTTARNLGLREAGTRYVVFLDNDVTVTPGWLDALVRCAEETGAAFVSPVICIGGASPPVVHVAGGVNRLENDGAHRRFIETYANAHRPLSDVLAEIDRSPITMAEFHAVLVRKDALNDIGGLDERCSTAFEHNDLCLTIGERGGVGWLEPNAIVDYVPDRPTSPENAIYHLLRWNRAWIDESLQHFCAKWGIDPDDPALVPDLESLHSRRRRPALHVRALARKLAGEAAVSRVDTWTDALVETALRKRHDLAPPRAEISRFAPAGS